MRALRYWQCHKARGEGTARAPQWCWLYPAAAFSHATPDEAAVLAVLGATQPGRHGPCCSQLSRHDDPPPSYDEVAEKAPRYSALFQVLENGELTPLSLEVPMVAVAAVPSAPEGEAAVEDGGPNSEPPAADHRGDGQQDQEQEAEAEVDALTPLRHLVSSRGGTRWHRANGSHCIPVPRSESELTPACCYP